jgi:hypothetical protein
MSSRDYLRNDLGALACANGSRAVGATRRHPGSSGMKGKGRKRAASQSNSERERVGDDEDYLSE